MADTLVVPAVAPLGSIVCLPSISTAITLNLKTMKDLSAIASRAAFRNMIVRIQEDLAQVRR